MTPQIDEKSTKSSPVHKQIVSPTGSPKSRLGPRVLVVFPPKGVWGNRGGSHNASADFSLKEIWPQARFSPRLVTKLLRNAWLLDASPRQWAPEVDLQSGPQSSQT